MFERIRDGIVNFITSRTSVLTILFLVMAGVLIQRIFELQIVNGETYQNEFSLQIGRNGPFPAPAETSMTGTESSLPTTIWPIP